jgi:hypothetical protein
LGHQRRFEEWKVTGASFLASRDNSRRILAEKIEKKFVYAESTVPGGSARRYFDTIKEIRQVDEKKIEAWEAPSFFLP